ncbi:hypothetical protein SD70_13250 [Gordoniibacillus kamchatkensis]|uniref:HTH araC/xylS-type domain-containing protein n=1 Tax=Gordoniibacillus kamchatkensis TaxID=1590651 RepID=A0ABR5AHR8_9BACL|nr:helix-turn-helix domain-containing protein [Paenibacillus sp. VKM B-2647]KIL40521.1 hypothetical protein SD70_13250 [Paenibacillus sp. VKM B-2647]
MVALLRLAFTNFRFRSLFFRVLLSLLALVVMPVLVVGFFGNWYSQSSIQKEVGQSSLQMLEQTRRLMDNLLDDMDKMAIQLAKDRKLSDLMAAGSVEDMSKELSTVQDYLNNYYASSPYITSIYVYYKNSGMVQVTLTGMEKIADFQDKDWLPIFNRMKRTEGKWVVRGSQAGIGGNPQQSSQVSLIRPVPLVGNDFSGAIVVNVNQQSVFQSPSFRLLREGEEIWMVSPDGLHAYNNKSGQEVAPEQFGRIQKLLGSDIDSFTQSIGDTELSFSSVTSPYTGWKYIDVLPTRIMLARGEKIQTFMYVLAAFSMIVAVICALLMAKAIYQPIYSLFEYAQNKRKDAGEAFRKDDKSEFSFLFSAMRTMKEKGEVLEHRLKENMPVLRQSFLGSVLHEQTRNHEDRNRNFEYYGMPVTRYAFFVAILRIDNYPTFVSAYSSQDQSLLRYFISKLAEELAETYFHVMPVNTESKDVILICNLRGELSKEDFSVQSVDAMRTILQHIRSYLPITVSIGIGSMKPHSGDIPVSYQEALEALEIRAFKGYEVIAVHSSMKGEHGPSISVVNRLKEFKRDLLAELREAEDSRAESGLEAFHDFMKTLESYPFGFIQHAYLQLTEEVYQRSLELGLTPEGDIGLPQLYDKVMKQETIDQLSEWFRAYYREAKESLNQLYEAKKSNVGQEIVAYIQANFDKDISLGGIADKLNMDPSYVSRLFKHEISMNFMEYLISLRLERAKKLLLESSLSVKAIGESVGYANQQSFNRIFKKYEGLTPGEYREHHAPNKLKDDEIY